MAVFTPLTDADITQYLQEYDLGALRSWHGIVEGVENSNFMVETTTGRYILTLFEARTQREDIPFFLALMAHYSSAGIPCPEPIMGKDGAVLRALKQRPAIIISFLQGLWHKQPTAAMAAQVGNLLGTMHKASDSFTQRKPNRMDSTEVARLCHKSLSKADSVETGLADLMQATLPRVNALWPHTLPTGAIHADIFPDNIFFLDGQLSGVIDFYFAATDMYALDVAIAVNAWCFDDITYNPAKGKALLDAYQQHRPFTDAEKKAFAVINQFACLRFLATRLHDWLFTDARAVVMKKDPREYSAKLRFHQEHTILS
jgi:homoserine kinase type II